MTWQDFLKSKLATWSLGIALLLIMVFASRVMIQKYEIDREIAKLESQVAKVKQDNDQLSSLIQYLNSSDYQDKAAREKLNLKKNGEYVVGLPSGDETTAGAQAQASQSHFKSWFDYFFSRNQ